MERIEAILNYWFEGADDKTLADRKKFPFKKWFIKSKKTDEEIREQFESDLLAAAEGKHQDWADSAQGRLALIILLDQFSRNIYRDTPQMYAYDAQALELALDAIVSDQDMDLPLIQRTFLYMPLMHSEDFDIQKVSLECFSDLVEESKEKSPENTPYYEYTYKFAQEHHDTIKKSGRFPYRDVILKRGDSGDV